MSTDVRSMVSLPGKGIDEETLKAIETAPPSIEDYAPLAEFDPGIDETTLRRIVMSLVHGTPMPELRSANERRIADRLYAEVHTIKSQGGGVELPFDTVGGELDPAGFIKYNHNHDEHGRFAEADASVILGEKIGEQAGSIQGGVYEGKDKVKRYVKFYDQPKQAVNERVANEVYRALGFNTPKSVVFPTKDGRGGFASEIMPNKGVLGSKYTPDEAQEVSQGIAADILLGNRDVLGMGGTNILRLTNGELGRIDHGGALFYRALGTPKTAEALGNLQEVEGFFNPQFDMGRLMHKGGLTELSDVPDIKDQIDQIEAINETPKGWENIVAAANTKAGPEYDQKLSDLLRHRASKLIQWRDTKMGNDLGWDHDLEGPALESWHDAPSTPEEWQTIPDDPDIAEPKFPKTNWKKPGAGVIIEEPDGRVWIVKPTNHFGGYLHTFPKGTQEDGLSLQQTALKEAYEETGLKVKLTGHFGDYNRDTSVGRYYTAVRVGGSPLDHGWETAKVKLVAPEQLDGYLNRAKDKEIAAHIIDYPGEVPSVPDEKPRPKKDYSQEYSDDGYRQGSFEQKLREYYRSLHKFDDSKHPHYPAGTPGGLGGQFMPTGTADEILTHLSPGVSSGSVLYNSKVKALHAAANHPTNPVTAISNTSSYSKASHGYAKKFIALKSEALAHAMAVAEKEKVKALPPEPPLWNASHQQAKWNNKTVQKLTAAAKGPDPMDAVAHVSVGATAKPFVKNYKDSLMKHFAKQQGPVNWKQFLPSAPGELNNSATAETFPSPPSTQPWMTHSKAGIKNVLLAAKTGSSTAVINASTKGALLSVKNWQKKVGLLLQKNPKLQVPADLLQQHSALAHQQALTVPVKPTVEGLGSADQVALDNISAAGHSGNHVYLTHMSTAGMNPAVKQYQLKVLEYLNNKPGSPSKLTTAANQASINAELTSNPADHKAAMEAHAKAKLAWDNQGHDLWVMHHADKEQYHSEYVKEATRPVIDAKHIDYTYTTEKQVDKLKEAVESKKQPLVIPEAPPVKPGVPEDQVKLYTEKIAKIKAAALMSDPIASIDAIPGQSGSIQSYKNAVKAAVFAHQGQKVKEIGDTVASLKLVGKGEPLYPANFPERDHKDFAAAALVFRQQLPHAEQVALGSYQGSGYGTVNSELRHHGNKLEVDGLTTAAKIRSLDKMFEKTSLPMDTHVIRNIGNVEQLQLTAHSLVGHIVQDPAFMSSSLKGSFGSGLPVSLHLNVPKGSKALYLTSGLHSNSPSEYEVVIARRSLFRVDKVEEVTGGYYHNKTVVIHASMLPRHLQPVNK